MTYSDRNVQTHTCYLNKNPNLYHNTEDKCFTNKVIGGGGDNLRTCSEKVKDNDDCNVRKLMWYNNGNSKCACCTKVDIFDKT